MYTAILWKAIIRRKSDSNLGCTWCCPLEHGIDPESSNRATAIYCLNIVVGLLLRNEAPYLDVAVKGNYDLAPRILLAWLSELDPAPNEFSFYPNWQYKAGEHLSPIQNTIGLIILTSNLSD